MRKPLLSREGANVEIVDGAGQGVHMPGPYGEEGRIVQQGWDDYWTTLSTGLVSTTAAGSGLAAWRSSPRRTWRRRGTAPS